MNKEIGKSWEVYAQHSHFFGLGFYVNLYYPQMINIDLLFWSVGVIYWKAKSIC